MVLLQSRQVVNLISQSHFITGNSNSKDLQETTQLDTTHFNFHSPLITSVFKRLDFVAPTNILSSQKKNCNSRCPVLLTLR